MMKRLVLLSALLLLVSLLSGCASSGTNGDVATFNTERYDQSMGSAGFNEVYMRGYYR